MNKKVIWFLLISIPIFFWSTHAVSMKYLIHTFEMSPMLITFYRFFLGGLSLLWAYLILNIWKWSIKKDFRELKIILLDKALWFSSIALFLNFVTFNYGLKYTLATNSILIESLFPLVVFFLWIVFYKKYLKVSWINRRKVFFTLIFASIWSGLLVMNKGLSLSGEDYKILGDFLAFLSMISIAFFVIYNFILSKKYEKFNGLLISSVGLFMGMIFSFPFVFNEILEIFLYSKEQLLILLFLWIWSTGIAYICWFFVPKFLNHITMSIFVNIIGITTLGIEYLVFPNQTLLSAEMLLAVLLVLGSSFYVEYLNSKEQE